MADDDFKSGRGSTFDDRATASRLPRTVPGIALRDQNTLGHWFEVVGPEGHRMVVRQTDVGPAEWTGRSIDINAPAARMAGYHEANFPTDAVWKYRHLGETLPSGVQEGLQRSSQVAQGPTGPRAMTQRYWEQGRAATQQATGGDLEIIDRTAVSGLRHVGKLEHGKPEGMIIHHTSGTGGVEGVEATLRARGLGVQYVIDRDAKAYRLLPEGEAAWHAGGRGSDRGDYYNKNYVGVEIIAKSDADVTAKQMATAGQLIGWSSRTAGYDPLKAVKGHGEVSSNKEADEGRKVVTALRFGKLNLGGGKTQIALGPKLGSETYWNQGKVQTQAPVEVAKRGLTSVAGLSAPQPEAARREATPAARHYERPAAPADAKPRSEPGAQSQVAEGPRTGSAAYWRGPQRGHQGEEAQEATRIASARRARGNAGKAAGERHDADPTIPYAGSTMPLGESSPSDAPAPVAYGSEGGVPNEVFIYVKLS